jgi:hypothetical protein
MATARPVSSPTCPLFRFWWVADLNTHLVYQISFAICFKLSCGVLFLQMSLIVHTLLTRNNTGCEVSKMQCTCTVIPCTEAEPASDRLIKKVYNCIYLLHSFSANPESCQNDIDYGQATWQTPITLTTNLQLPMSLQKQCNTTSPRFKCLFIVPALSNGSLYWQNYTKLSNGMNNELERICKEAVIA